MIKVYGLKWVPPMVQGLVRDLRLRWALEEAGLPYEEELVGMEELASNHYRALQPFGQIPVYEEEDLTLFESGAIVLHIAEKSEKLMPRDSAERAHVISWMFAALNSIEPSVQHLGMMDGFYNNDAWQQLRPRVVQQIERRLDALAQRLEGRDYLVGRFSVADILMTTVLRILRETDLVERRYTLDRYKLRCEARPAFERALQAQMAAYERHEPVKA
jgi:glutathione S-transferase